MTRVRWLNYEGMLKIEARADATRGAPTAPQ
jgi:hypothetical protein